MTIALNEHTLPYRTDLFVAGARCFLSTNSHDILRAAAQWRSDSEQNSVRSFEMEVMVESSMDKIPEYPAHFRGLRHLVFAKLPPRSFIAFDLLRRRVYAVLSNAAAKDTSFWNTRLLPITIGVLGTTLGVVPLHSACLDRNGKGALIAGVSGAGKSTLATAMAQRGFSLLSDDWTYISKQQNALVAHGLYSPLKLLPDAARFFAELQQFTPGLSLNGELAYEIQPAESIRVAVTNVSYPHSIFFLERTTAPGCNLFPCRPQYVCEFFEKNAERLPNEIPEAKSFRSTVIKILSALPAWIIRTGASPHRTAEHLSEFLLEATRATA
jgi:HPr Serine kinase C-terminal domain